MSRIASRSTHSLRTRTRTLALAAVAVVALTGCNTAEANAPSKTRMVYGSAKALGNGTARVFVTLDADKRPTSLGVAFSESAMTGLPTTPMAPSPSAAMLMLALPEEARTTGFDHVMVDWNPNGHEPDQVYTHPHFDFHFYTMTEAQQMAIMPNAPDFAQRAARVPEAQFAPAGYLPAHLITKQAAAEQTVPMMGLHWIDVGASELNGHMFTTTFLWGSYDGRFIFIEPMITKAYIESAKTVAGNTLVSALKAPAKYDRAGYYPDSYSIRWDATAKEYRVSLDGLAHQK